MSLLEVLTAVTLAVLVAGLVFVAYNTVSRVHDQFVQRQQTVQPALDALDTFGRDLACLCTPPPGAEALPTLGPSPDAPDGIRRMCFYTASLPPGETDARWFEIQRVCYEWPARDDMPGTLTRSAGVLLGTGTVVALPPRPLLRDVQSCRVLLGDGVTWTDSWPCAEAEALPAQARMELLMPGPGAQRGLSRQVMVPAGRAAARGTDADGPGAADKGQTARVALP